MANLLNANLPSDDEEDDDFVPDEVDSEEEAVKKQKAKKPKKRLRGSAAAAGEGEGSSEEEEEATPVEKTVPESKRLEKKAKVDEMWSMLNAPKPGSGKRPAGGSGAALGALCKPAPKQGGNSAGDALLRQLGLGGAKTKPTSGAEPSADRKAVAAAALAAARAAASVTAGQQFGMVTVTETRRFAGQTITVQREVQAGAAPSGGAAPVSAPGAAPASAPGAPPAAGGDAAAAAQKKAGLDAVLESLAQAKKVSVLDKTRSDWREFKRSDDAVEEELEAHKRSGAAFLDRQAFLSRAELAEYERERDQRLGSNVRNRGRL
jgi:hypothetical protein